MRSAMDFAGDKFIAFSTWAWIEAQAKTGKQPIYRYRFDMAPPSDPKAPRLGAYHSAEIEYVFGQLDSKAGVPWRSEDRALSEQMHEILVSNFAKNGDPNGPGLPKWPMYSAADGWPVMFLTDKPDGAQRRPAGSVSVFGISVEEIACGNSPLLQLLSS